jgi:hypothetical protein
MLCMFALTFGRLARFSRTEWDPSDQRTCGAACRLMLTSAGVAPWVNSLIVDGVIGAWAVF